LRLNKITGICVHCAGMCVLVSACKNRITLASWNRAVTHTHTHTHLTLT